MYEVIDKQEIKYADMFALFINAVLLVDMIRMFTNSTIAVNIVQYGIYISCALYGYLQLLYYKKMKIDKKLFWIISITILISFISYIVCPEVIKAYSYYVAFFFTRIIPALYFTIYSNNRKLILTFEKLKKYRFIWLFYAIVGFIWIPLHTNSWNQYSMTYGYNLLIPFCIVSYCFIRYRKIKWLLYTIIFSVFMLLRGSRAAVLCLVVFVVLAYIMINKDSLNISKMTKIIILLIAGIFASINFKTIMSLLSNIFPSSRTLALLSTNIKFDSGRSNIQSLYWKAIKSHPFRFNGIFSDRIYYSNVTGHVYNMTNYPHNFIVELFYQWGILFGGTIFIAIIVCIIISLQYGNKNNRTELLCFILTMFVAGFFKLFFSGSYLVSVEFYLLIGIILYICGKNKINDKDEI